jgi:predicted nucleic acid-binding protein
MVQIIADSSALILLAKCGLLKEVCTLFQVIAPPGVIAEVASEQLVSSYPDAALISSLASQGSIKVQSPPSEKISLPVSLHQGETEALFLAMAVPGVLFATDDGKAIKAAKFAKIPFIITPKIVVELFRLRKISLKKAQGSLEKLNKIGRYSPEIIAEALLSLKEASNG